MSKAFSRSVDDLADLEAAACHTFVADSSFDHFVDNLDSVMIAELAVLVMSHDKIHKSCHLIALIEFVDLTFHRLSRVFSCISQVPHAAHN
jgi:hypothetical protein